jgi:hypothetical protein
MLADAVDLGDGRARLEKLPVDRLLVLQREARLRQREQRRAAA